METIMEDSASNPQVPGEESQQSQTAQDYITSQLQLEADAREALPYQFDTCTKPLGQLRQSVFSCLTCNPPPEDASKPYTPAGVCYSCSISCHGEHDLVELFTRRNFVCDCGTTRLPTTAECTLRINERTGVKGAVHSDEPAVTNSYNQNYRNRFCGCNELYDPAKEKGTMFQCLGLGTLADGGCGEDWWHPECILGISREAQDDKSQAEKTSDEMPATGQAVATDAANANTTTTANGAIGHVDSINQGQELNNDDDTHDLDDPPLPYGFPAEDDFEHFLCYKCVNAFPWIKRYAGNSGFLPAVSHKTVDAADVGQDETSGPTTTVDAQASQNLGDGTSTAPEANRKRKSPGEDNLTEDAASKAVGPSSDNASRNPDEWVPSLSEGSWGLLGMRRKRNSQDFEDQAYGDNASLGPIKNDDGRERAAKKHKSNSDGNSNNTDAVAAPMTTTTTAPTEISRAPEPPVCTYNALPPIPADSPNISLFMTDDFHPQLCYCRTCFPLLLPHPQLLEPEINYSPPISAASSPAPGMPGLDTVHPRNGSTTHSTGSARSLLDRGEAALSNMDRARAIEGVMAYNKLKDGLKGFLKPFAESGQPVSAEDIKGHFEKLRGDATGAAAGVVGGGGDDGGGDGDGRREQRGY